MTLRVSNFIGKRTITDEQNGKTTKVTFELPHHATLSELAMDEIRHIAKQCYDIMSNPENEHVIFINNIYTIEEVTNV